MEAANAANLAKLAENDAMVRRIASQCNDWHLDDLLWAMPAGFGACKVHCCSGWGPAKGVQMCMAIPEHHYCHLPCC